ncbi:hypothetical protein FRC03_012123 [Tulasnella sp. 419]|nr:hypothetical protein FRC03_012123 [Tulasnella sp. 419]
MATGSIDGSISLWDTTVSTSSKARKKHAGRVRSLCVSPDGTKVASGSDDTKVCVWDCSTGDCIITLSGHSTVVESVSFTPDGACIRSNDRNGREILWDSQTLQQSSRSDADLTLPGRDPEGSSSSVSTEARGHLSLDDRWVIFHSPTSSSYRVCLLPILDITTHVIFAFRLVIGTHSGYVQVLDFSGLISSFT